MTNQNSKSGTNSMAVPEAKSAMNRFKEEVASELGVNLKDGYNGDLTSRQNGSVGGYMVNIMIAQRSKNFYRRNPIISGLPQGMDYTYQVVI